MSLTLISKLSIPNEAFSSGLKLGATRNKRLRAVKVKSLCPPAATLAVTGTGCTFIQSAHIPSDAPYELLV